MNRIKYEQWYGAAGYNAVARKKIKELEKSAGIPTAIIKQDGYDDALMGVAAALDTSVTTPTYTCTNMTYEQARSIILSGSLLKVVVMNYEQSDGALSLIQSEIMQVSFEQSSESQYIYLATQGIELKWTPDGFEDVGK